MARNLRILRSSNSVGFSFGTLCWAEDALFFMIRAGRASTLPGSEDMIGPLLTRAPLRVPVKRDAHVIDLLRNVHCGIEEPRNHGIVREDEFRNVSSEAAAHALHGININFEPPSSGLTLDSDALFSVPDDVRDGLGHYTLSFILSGELRQGRGGGVKMDVTYEELIPRRCV